MQDDFWEQNAVQWNQLINAGIFKSRQITNAAILNEIQRHQFKSLLDVGCGEGWIAGALDLTSIDYLGIDGSKALIEIARAKHKTHFENVSYQELIQGKLTPPQRFDAVIFNFSLLEEEISDLLRTSSFFLRPQGLMLIQTLHPCFALNEYRNGWNTEDFKSSGIEFSGKMSWYGRTLGAWVQLFENCELNLKEIIEPLNEGKPASIIFILRPAT